MEDMADWTSGDFNISWSGVPHVDIGAVNTMKLYAALSASALALFLAACSDSSESSTPAPATPVTVEGLSGSQAQLEIDRAAYEEIRKVWDELSESIKTATAEGDLEKAAELRADRGEIKSEYVAARDKYRATRRAQDQ
ncbi:hypothetical protein [Aquibium oceanicum]|uniref:hypothetical protein n=1 Tax=Aquibium oceanicum TaxID=1670800 RepID=UPI0012FFC545|nr:hypothetical protein [Aquibium oceanicum]